MSSIPLVPTVMDSAFLEQANVWDWHPIGNGMRSELDMIFRDLTLDAAVAHPELFGFLLH